VNMSCKDEYDVLFNNCALQ